LRHATGIIDRQTAITAEKKKGGIVMFVKRAAAFNSFRRGYA